MFKAVLSQLERLPFERNKGDFHDREGVFLLLKRQFLRADEDELLHICENLSAEERQRLLDEVDNGLGHCLICQVLRENGNQNLSDLPDRLFELLTQVFVEILDHRLHIVDQSSELLSVVLRRVLELLHVPLQSPLEDLKSDLRVH